MKITDINLATVEVEIISSRYADDIEGYIVWAETDDERVLTEDELDDLNNDYQTHEFIAERAMER